jgi:16S rRNA (guanine527-N7)-methyltransferase
MADQLALILAEIQRRGGIGRGDVASAIAHSERFVAAAGQPRSIVDLGSGGGLPGLVVAVRLEHARVALIERRSKRADLLRYGVRALGLGDRVRVCECDVAAFVAADADEIDLVTARSFGSPAQVLAAAAPLLRPGGMLLVSEPPSDRDRWVESLLAEFEMVDEGLHDGVRRLVRAERNPSRFT